MTKRATIWSKPNCHYCVLAKKLLENRGIDYDEIVVTDDTIVEFVETFPKVKTVPQIILDGEVVGGYNDLITKLPPNEAF